MAGTIWEFFGFRADDKSEAALEAALTETCPILGQKCEKTFNDGVISGVCTLKPVTTGPVICCPIRLYAEGYKILKDVAVQAFEDDYELIPKRDAVAWSKAQNKPCVAVFGKGWGGELHLPQRAGTGSYFVDWVLAKLNILGELEEFVAIEVQTIDTTGTYRNGYQALKDGRQVEGTTAGLNWENVNKRILPQLIYKGRVLQREEMCRKGLFFVCPEPVSERIMKRLGGIDNLVRFSALQPSSLTFAVYNHDPDYKYNDGELVPLSKSFSHSTIVQQVQEAFNNVTLPEENVYRNAILKALGIE